MTMAPPKPAARVATGPVAPRSSEPDSVIIPRMASGRLRRTWYAPWRRGRLLGSTVDERNRGGSLIASAARILNTKLDGLTHRKAEAWMGEGWSMFDLVGELHFLSTTLARRAARASFYVGRVDGGAVVPLPNPVTADGKPLPPADRNPNDNVARAIFSALGDGFMGVQEVVERAFLNQFVVGACYLVGAPTEVWDLAVPKANRPPLRPVNTVPVDQLVWKTLSVTEFLEAEAGIYEWRQGGSEARGKSSVKIGSEFVYVVALWNPHPSDSSVPDSPVRATLPILRELVGLTQHVSAQIDSRLAGAGMLIMRSSATRAIKRAMGLPEDGPEDPFTEMLIKAMVTPIADRDSASAVVPFVTTIPDEAGAPQFLSFATPFDQNTSVLREEAIRRIALSLDAPPELLLGQEDANHWSAWLTAQEVVDSHIAPTLALIARAFTVEYLRPILRGTGLTAAQAESYAIWYDTSDLVTQANQGANAQALYQMDAISDETLRRANGFDESDAPKKADVKDQAIDMVKNMVAANPGLMNRPGLDVLVDQITALLNGTPQSGLAASAAAKASSGSAQIGTPSSPGGSGASGAGSPPSSGASVTPPASPASPATGAAPTPSAAGGVPGTRIPAAAATTAFGSWDSDQFEMTR